MSPHTGHEEDDRIRRATHGVGAGHEGLDQLAERLGLEGQEWIDGRRLALRGRSGRWYLWIELLHAHLDYVERLAGVPTSRPLED